MGWIMKVTNNTSFVVIAFGWREPTGYADDVSIAPGATEDVNGPYVGEMNGHPCFVALEGELTCQETPDDDNGIQILPGMHIYLGAGDRGITIRHHSDSPEEYVLRWRAAQPAR